jgi:lysozyme
MSVDFKVLTRWLELDEGCRLKPYYCTGGKLTIGIGRNLEAKGISRAEAQFMLESDLVDVIKELDELLPYWRDLSEVRQMVLINMAFNLGTFGLLNFKRTLAHIQAQEWDQAADEMLRSEWAEQVGERAVRLSEAMRNESIPV